MTAVSPRVTAAEVSGRSFGQRRVLRVGPLSMVWDRRTITVCAALITATLVVSVWSVMVGDFDLTAKQVFDVIFNVQGEPGNGGANFVVWTLRLPRVLTALGVGACLGMSGAMFQSLVRNPLGSPDIVGFESGAALGAVLVIVGGSSVTVHIAVGAVAGGLAAAMLVYVLAWRNGLLAARLVLIGIGIGFTALAAVDFLIIQADIRDVQRAAVWLTGSLNGRGWNHVVAVTIVLAVTLPIMMVVERSLNRLGLGDDTATALGISVGRVKLGVVLLAVVLASIAVAVAGPIGFIAFVSGPIARRLVNSPNASILPAGLVGSFVTVTADLAARRLLAPTELPVGVFTAVFGAPYLIWLLLRQSRTGTL